MPWLRRLHRWFGLLVALPVAIQGLTGAILAFEPLLPDPPALAARLTQLTPAQDRADLTTQPRTAHSRTKEAQTAQAESSETQTLEARATQARMAQTQATPPGQAASSRSGATTTSDGAS